MPEECPAPNCRFFLWDPGAPCPACGTPPHAAQATTTLGGLAVAAVVMLLLALTLDGVWRVLAIFAAGGAAILAILHAWRIRADRQATTVTLDSRYAAADERTTHWLTTWSELYSLGAETADDAAEDEGQLLSEAREVAGKAATEAVRVRSEIAEQYVANGFDRLRYLLETHRSYLLNVWIARWTDAVASTDHYLAVLPVAPEAALGARSELAQLQRSARRIRAARAASGVHLTDMPSDPVPIDTTVDEIDIERRRLRVERSLFLDQPLPDDL